MCKKYYELMCIFPPQNPTPVGCGVCIFQFPSAEPDMFDRYNLVTANIWQDLTANLCVFVLITVPSKALAAGITAVYFPSSLLTLSRPLHIDKLYVISGMDKHENIWVERAAMLWHSVYTAFSSRLESAHWDKRTTKPGRQEPVPCSDGSTKILLWFYN